MKKLLLFPLAFICTSALAAPLQQPPAPPAHTGDATSDHYYQQRYRDQHYMWEQQVQAQLENQAKEIKRLKAELDKRDG